MRIAAHTPVTVYFTVAAPYPAFSVPTPQLIDLKLYDVLEAAPIPGYPVTLSG